MIKCEIEFPDDFPNIDTTNTNIEKFCKKLPTPEDLINYYNRNKKTILKKFLKQYSRLQEKYFSTIKHYKITDFLPLAKVKCEKCGYFTIRFDKYNHYIRSNECPKCYNKSYFKIEKNPAIQKTEILTSEIQE